MFLTKQYIDTIIKFVDNCYHSVPSLLIPWDESFSQRRVLRINGGRQTGKTSGVEIVIPKLKSYGTLIHIPFYKKLGNKSADFVFTLKNFKEDLRGIKIDGPPIVLIEEPINIVSDEVLLEMYHTLKLNMLEYKEPIFIIIGCQGKESKPKVSDHKPLDAEKVKKANVIKKAEAALGALYKAEIDLLFEKLNLEETPIISEYEAISQRIHQLDIASDKLKESSMWACRAIFEPVETY